MVKVSDSQGKTFHGSYTDSNTALPLERIDVGNLCQPTLLRAPEVILGHPWSTPIDIWSVGCLVSTTTICAPFLKLTNTMLYKVFEHLAGTALFQLCKIPTISIADSHLCRMTEHLGSFPPDFLAKCSKRTEYFDENGELFSVFHVR